MHIADYFLNFYMPNILKSVTVITASSQ